MHNAIFREKTSLLYKTKQIHNRMCFKSYTFLSQDTTTRHIDQVQRRFSEPYEHQCFKDNIEKKRRTLCRKLYCLLFFVVVFFPLHLSGIYR